MKEVERFLVLLYSCTSQILTVNATKKQLFFPMAIKSWKIFLLQERLQHVKHASFQAGYIWGQALIANQVLVIGIGRRMQMEDGHHCGQLFQKLPNNAENSLNATARNAVLDTVNVTRPT